MRGCCPPRPSMKSHPSVLPQENPARIKGEFCRMISLEEFRSWRVAMLHRAGRIPATEGQGRADPCPTATEQQLRAETRLPSRQSGQERELEGDHRQRHCARR